MEAIAALAKLADERRADTIRVRLQAVSTTADGTLSQAVARAMQELDNRFSTQQIAANKRAEKMQEPAKTLLIDNRPWRMSSSKPRRPPRRPSWTSRP